MRNPLTVIVFIMLVAGCGEQSADTQAAPSNVLKCKSIAELFSASASGGVAQCVSDSDCGCAPASLLSAHGGTNCGGVTGQRNASILQDLEKQFREAGCERDFNCAPQACQPSCRDGICVNAGFE